MVRTLGPPTWFMTFSCNDLNWPDMTKALLIAEGRDVNEAESLTFPERLQLVQKHPVVVSRQFTVRVNALMRFLKRDPDCLGGPVVDFWYRIEFQNRGSPHLHMLVWCDNIPDFMTNEGIEVIERVVSCSLMPDDPVLKTLIEDVQTHKHTATCYKNRNDRYCRFGFPRPAHETTICLGPDEVLSNNGRFCCLKRTADETMVNNYNPTLLSLWKGNIDVQPCGNVTAVAYYVAKYASKCEPHDTGEVVREAVAKAKRQGGPVWNQLFAVSMAILSQRLVSAPECAYRLCHLPLKMSSRKTVFINSCKPNERFRLLRFDSDDTSIYNNIFDRYILRPDELEQLSLAEFAVRFESISNSSWNEDNGDEELRREDVSPARYIRLRDNTRMRIRNKSAVLRTRYFTLSSDKEAYYYSLLVCHVPFRDESDLLLEEETAEQCFIRRQRDLRPLQGNVSAEEFAHAEQMIQQALAQAVALNAARDAGDVGDAPLIYCGEQIVNNDDNYCEDVCERSVMPDEVFLGNIRGLNVQQKDLFQKVSAAVESDLQGHESQLLLFITGGAGSGKSFVLKLLVEHIKRCYAPTVDILLKAKFVELGSLTGVAARQIFGKTLHSIFSLPIEKGNTMTYKKMTGQKLENERRKWRHINWLIIDEISMVSYENLRIIHLRLQEYKNNDNLFGGVHILLFGDILQLPPSMMLGIESRVMLRRNISVSDGLVNGAMGVVKKIKWPALRRDQLEEGELPESVLLQFDDPSVGLRIKDDEGYVAISPVCTTFQAQRGYGDVERRMLPLILSWAVTVHKLQGTTLDKAVIDLGKKNFAKGQIYVALSRVKTLEGIALSDLDANKLLIRPHDEKALTEMIRLRNLNNN
ncbi:uncharacterized protein LOC124634135 [Helicoverpa zea]|uniref:uncharacterized protein LOC124634135 n=1 Tax=Helicoverpa zea TaxID=7113 RepID=UPI001F574A86|nr:uncharacterized protein LOC124634135 [Helicoverpa zea]